MERRNDTRNITVTEETTLRELLEMIGAVGRSGENADRKGSPGEEA